MFTMKPQNKKIHNHILYGPFITVKYEFLPPKSQLYIGVSNSTHYKFLVFLVSVKIL